MYKGKDFGTPFKKRGVPLLPLKKISTWGWYLYRIAAQPPKAAATYCRMCQKAARSARCDILSHWQRTPEGGATSCAL